MIEARLPGGGRAVFTGRQEGDMGHGGVYATDGDPAVQRRRRAVVDLEWTWLRQVHGAEVVEVTAPGAGAGSRADGAVTAAPGCALAVLTADCAPVALGSPEGVVGAVHAGWAGLTAGVVERVVEAMASAGASEIAAVIGPCIGPECYEFGPDDLARVIERVGPTAASTAASGRPALDLAAGVRAVLEGSRVTRVDDVGICTACSPGYYSWRARRDRQRQAAVVWR